MQKHLLSAALTHLLEQPYSQKVWTRSSAVPAEQQEGSSSQFLKGRKVRQHQQWVMIKDQQFSCSILKLIQLLYKLIIYQTSFKSDN